MRRRDHHAAQRHGRHSEALCMLVLRLKGYRLLAHHWKCPMGEIDIVARRGRTVAFVEVKARDAHEAAATALTPRQRLRIERAALHFVATRPELGGLDLRFDVMLVTPWRLPHHLANAWLAAA